MRFLVTCVAACLVTVAVQARAGRWARDENAVVEADGAEGETGTEEASTVQASTQFAEEPIECEPYNYCDGTNFEKRLRVQDRAVTCDNEPNSKDRCCLPYAKHLVCYNIMVEGQYLNYDRDDYMMTTDFAGLCQAMAESQGRAFGKYSGASLVAGKEGTVIYRYGQWEELSTPGTEQLLDIACEVTDTPTTAPPEKIQD